MLASFTTTALSHAADFEPKVLLVQPAKSEAAAGYALVRVRGELVAEGFDVTILETTPGTTSAEAMAAAGQDGASATIGLFLSADGSDAELWVVDKLTAKTVVRHVRTATNPSEQLSEVLATRVVELLRASLLEVVVAQRHGAAQTAVTTSPQTKKKAASWAAKPLQLSGDHEVRFHLGEAMVWNPSQLGPAFLLAGRFEWLLSAMVHPRLSFIGLGTSPRVTRAEGEASVQQGGGLLEIGIMPLTENTYRPQLTLGAGLWHTAVEGRASWPYEGSNFERWGFAVDAGIGTTLPLTNVLALVAEGHATLVTPNPVIRFAGHDVARVGRPIVSTSLALSVAL
ncbi:MAG: hypothetical protein QM784_40550 [Polyangiaceae bacterium]